MNREKEQIRALRESYNRATLSVADINTDPFSQFRSWFDAAHAADIFEVNAMQLATVGADGQPTVRTVLLKEIEDDGYIFYTNYESRKGIQINENDKVALLFFWKELEQQIRIEGTVQKISAKHSLEYYHTRPRGSQIGAWSSPQSQRISRDALEQRVAEYSDQYADESVEIPLPPFWGGYKVVPHYFEFWQGRQSRLHDRIVYELTDETWDIYRIAP